MTCSIIITAAILGGAVAYDGLPESSCRHPEVVAELVLSHRHPCWRLPKDRSYTVAAVPPPRDLQGFDE